MTRYKTARAKLPGASTTTAAALLGLGRTLLAEGKRRDALAPLQESLDMRRKLLPPEHPDIAASASALAQCSASLRTRVIPSVVTLLDHPMSDDNRPVTKLLEACRAGEDGAVDQLFPLVYEELRRLARRHLANERPGHTLAPTALVHEAYIRLVDVEIPWQDRQHFTQSPRRRCGEFWSIT